jgi:DNA helicase-2/ATP-dependent DNA helicase PcrA
MNLSIKQSQVVEADEKYMCVIAGAGSGKTRTLTERIKHLIKKKKVGERVLAITFSNKAANELKERLLLSYSESEIEDLIYVGTIHNFCMDIVSQRASAIGLPNDLHIFEAFADRYEIFKNALIGIPQLKAQYSDTQGNLDTRKVHDLFDKFGRAKRRLKFPEDYPDNPLIQRLYQDCNDLMLAQNAIDFDDILLYSYKVLIDKPAISRIYHRIFKHICVDEAQDLNKAQYSVIKAIAGESASILMVGDPNQSIYGFNGSSPKYMCDLFISEYGAKQYNLDENFRSSKAVIDAAKVIEPSFEMKGILPIAGEVTIQSFQNEADEADWVIEKLLFLVNDGHADIEGTNCTFEKCAVLARNKYVFASLEERLQQEGIKYNLRVSANKDVLSESPFFKLFDLGLKLIMNPLDILHFEEIKKSVNLSETEHDSFDKFKSCNEFRDALGEEDFNTLNSAWTMLDGTQNGFNFPKALEILKAYCTPANGDTDGDKFLLTHNDYLAWNNRWKLYVKTTTLEERSLANMMRAIALGIANLPADEGVTLSTVHMSKGLEFDVVFIIGLCEGVFPDYRAVDNESQLAEECHNMFVSITRSKRLCYLSYPMKRTMPWGEVWASSASRYVQILAKS